MKITIKSKLADIPIEEYKAVNFEAAKLLILEHISQTTIKDDDKKKLLEGIKKSRNFASMYSYFYNSLLKYEGLSVNNNNK